MAKNKKTDGNNDMNIAVKRKKIDFELDTFENSDIDWTIRDEDALTSHDGIKDFGSIDSIKDLVSEDVDNDAGSVMDEYENEETDETGYTVEESDESENDELDDEDFEVFDFNSYQERAYLRREETVNYTDKPKQEKHKKEKSKQEKSKQDKNKQDKHNKTTRLLSK